MRTLAVALLIALAVIQDPLWAGKGGWMHSWEMERQVAAQRDLNEGLRLRNAALEAEVRDLKAGTDAIEERARLELGLVSEGETFVQILEGSPASAAAVRPRQP